jgi:hypothetical protein
VKNSYFEYQKGKKTKHDKRKKKKNSKANEQQLTKFGAIEAARNDVQHLQQSAKVHGLPQHGSHSKQSQMAPTEPPQSRAHQ